MTIQGRMTTIRYFLIVLLVGNLASACVSAPPRKQFSRGEPIQTIATTNRHFIYAQEDVILEDDSLDNQLSELNLDWKSDLRKAHWYQGFATAAFIAQIATLAGCISTDEDALAWCGSSVALGVLALPLGNKAASLKHGVIQEYNRLASPAKKTQPESEL